MYYIPVFRLTISVYMGTNCV